MRSDWREAAGTVAGMGEKGLIEAAARAVARATAQGADAADALVVESVSLSAGCRLGRLEDVERSEGRDLGLRVFVGKSQANVSSTDLSPSAIEELAERAVAMARSAPEDPYCGLPDESLLARDWPDLDICDVHGPDADGLRDLALEAEAAAMAVEGVTNSLGAGANAGTGAVALVASNGFEGAYASSGYSISCAVVAGEGTAMERDYDFSSAVHFADLMAPAEIGRSAGEKAVRRLHPRKLASQSVPVIYHPRVANTLVGHFARAVSGNAVARGSSFLKGRLGKRVFPGAVSIIDDPRRRRGLRSRPFDGEGVTTARTALVADGVVRSWLLDCRSARQLGLESTGHAGRGIAGPPAPSSSNLYLEPGAVSPEALIGEIDRGLYVTDLIGMGVNATTGDYSRGAAGFWIEAGEVTYPVNEITVAGNLIEMYARLTAADDLEFRYGTNAPTLRIEGMTVAGK